MENPNPQGNCAWRKLTVIGRMYAQGGKMPAHRASEDMYTMGPLIYWVDYEPQPPSPCRADTMWLTDFFFCHTGGMDSPVQ